MNNTRPNNIIQLPLKNGSPADFTVREPEIELVRAFREESRGITFNTDGYDAIYKKLKIACESVDAMKGNLAELPTGDVADKVTAEIAKGETHISELRKKLMEADIVSYERNCKRLFNILQAQTAEDGSAISFEAIDWNKTSLTEVGKGITFFRISCGEIPSAPSN